MLMQILSTLHNATTLLFGIFISAFFLGIKQNFKNTWKLFLFTCLEGILLTATSQLFGDVFSIKMYPLLIHLPIILFLTFYYKYSFISSATSVLSAYLCCQISNWLGLLVFSISNSEVSYYIARIITTLLVFFLLCRLVCPTTATIFSKDKRKLCIISFLPFVYYIFDYVATKFTNMLYSGNKAIVEFMSFAFCIAYLIFLLVYFKEYEQVQENKQYRNLMEMQLSSIHNEIEQVQNSKQTLSILRHDMRHHLNLILTLLQNDSTDKVIDYIKKIDETYDDTIVTTYCKSEMLNSIISIYQRRFSDKSYTLNCKISCESPLFSEIAFCAILSNALENAMHALENMDSKAQWANLSISQKENSLLLSLENPVQHMPYFVDGIPISRKKGHGIGVKSIVYYSEQLNGQWHFSVSNGLFILRIII